MSDKKANLIIYSFILLIIVLVTLMGYCINSIFKHMDEYIIDTGERNNTVKDNNDKTNDFPDSYSSGEASGEFEYIYEVYESEDEIECNDIFKLGSWKTINGIQTYTNEYLNVKITSPNEKCYILLPQKGQIDIVEIDENDVGHTFMTAKLVKGPDFYNCQSDQMHYMLTYGLVYNESKEIIDGEEWLKLNPEDVSNYCYLYKSIDDGKYTLVLSAIDAFSIKKMVTKLNSELEIADFSTSIFDMGTWNNKTYTNEQLGITLTIPNGWEYTDSLKEGNLVLSNKDGGIFNINILQYHLKDKVMQDKAKMNSYNILEDFTAQIGGEEYAGLNVYNVWQNGPCIKKYYREIANHDYLLTIEAQNIEPHDIDTLSQILYNNKKSKVKEIVKPLDYKYVLKTGIIIGNEYINDYLGFKTIAPEGWINKVGIGGDTLEIRKEGVSGTIDIVRIVMSTGSAQEAVNHKYAFYNEIYSSDDGDINTSTKSIGNEEFYVLIHTDEKPDIGYKYLQELYYKNVYDGNYLMEIENTAYGSNGKIAPNLDINDMIKFY